MRDTGIEAGGFIPAYEGLAASARSGNELRGDVRDQAFDIARGFGIVLVVYGHALIGVQRTGGIDQLERTLVIVIYSFHMALFFAIAGLMSRGLIKQNFSTFLKKISLRLVYPYILWSLVTIIIQYGLRDYINEPIDRLDFMQILYSPVGIFWFLYVLILAYILAYLLRQCSRNQNIAVGIGCIVIGYTVDYGLVPLLRYIGIFLLTAQIKIVDLKALASSLPVMLAGGIVMLLTIGIAWQNANTPLVGQPAASILYLPAAFFGTLLVISLSTMVAKPTSRLNFRNGLATMLDYLGRRSLVIYLLHIFITVSIRLAAGKIGIAPELITIYGGTIAGLMIPVIAYEIIAKFGKTHWLGWA